MNRQEFIDKLRSTLNGSMTQTLVEEHIRYYEDYIATEMNKGRSEQEVLTMLGDPRLIARTIITTNTTEAESGAYESGAHQSRDYRDSAYQDGGFRQTVRRDHGEVVRHSRIPGWVWLLLVILILVFVLSIVMSVLSFLAPVLIPVIVVLFLVKLFRDWLN